MLIFRLLILFGSLQCLLAEFTEIERNPSLPVVDLGYELHQATFNVRATSLLGVIT